MTSPNHTTDFYRLRRANLTTVVRICVACGLPFKVPPSYKKVYCSLSCVTTQRHQRRRDNIVEFLMANRRITATDCWEWTRSLDAKGYGQSSFNERTSTGKCRPSRVHRMSYKIFKGEIPEGLEIDHLCRNHACFNPDHLEAVTHKVNMARGWNTLAARAACRLKDRANGA
jgi:hypothetical protein